MMGTTADKLEYLQGTKAAIKEAVVSKGVDVPESTTFRAYADKIGEISGGGGPWYQQFVDYLKTEGDKYTLNNPYTTISVTGDAENYEGFYGVYFEAISTPEQSALIPWPCITLMGYQLNGFRGEWSFEGAGAYMLIDSNGYNYGFRIKDFNAVIPCYMYVFKDSIVDFAS